MKKKISGIVAYVFCLTLTIGFGSFAMIYIVDMAAGRDVCYVKEYIWDTKYGDKEVFRQTMVPCKDLK